MQQNEADANDGGVQEIAVNSRNPISAMRDRTAPVVVESSQGENEGAPGSGEHTSDRQTVAGEAAHPSGSSPTSEQKSGNGATASSQVAGDRPKLITIPLSRIKSHPMNEALFGATSPTEIQILADSIGKVGLLERIRVTPDPKETGWWNYESGHKRGAALDLLGWTEVTVEVEEVTDEDERLLRLLEFNRKHVLTIDQQIQIGEIYFKLDKKQAKARQVAGGKLKKGAKGVETITQPPGQGGEGTKASKAEELGKARDLAAAKVGLSGVGLERGIKVREAAAKAEKEGEEVIAAELRQILCDRGINPAFMRAQAYNLIPKAKPKKARINNGGASEKSKLDGEKPEGQNASEHQLNADNSSASSGGSAAIDSDGGEIMQGEDEQFSSGEQVEGKSAYDRILFHSQKVVDEYGYVEFEELSVDQKGNLRRALADVKDLYWECREELD